MAQKPAPKLNTAPRLSPTDVLNREFGRSVLGFSTSEVEAFVAEMARYVEKSIRTEKELEARVEALNEELIRWKAREAELTKMREKAQADAEQWKAQAEKDAIAMIKEVETRAESIRHKTEEWLEEMVAAVEATEQRRASFVTAFRSALDSHYALLQSDDEPDKSLASRLNDFLKAGFGETARS